mmetsp:Transcript_108985/g.340984  ORF Transcript_108985/g.340984 Transcript_108985/m.340984 type:complete len:207 (-) Transcript_108985:729-1349(-)
MRSGRVRASCVIQSSRRPRATPSWAGIRRPAKQYLLSTAQSSWSSLGASDLAAAQAPLYAAADASMACVSFFSWGILTLQSGNFCSISNWARCRGQRISTLGARPAAPASLSAGQMPPASPPSRTDRLTASLTAYADALPEMAMSQRRLPAACATLTSVAFTPLTPCCATAAARASCSTGSVSARQASALKGATGTGLPSSRKPPR